MANKKSILTKNITLREALSKSISADGLVESLLLGEPENDIGDTLDMIDLLFDLSKGELREALREYLNGALKYGD